MTTSSLLLNLLVEGIVQGSVYALLAAGFSLLWWVSGIVHLAHGGVMLSGGLAVFLGLEAAGLPLPAALAVGGLVAVGLGLSLNATIYSPLLRRGTDEMGLLTASLGVLIAMEFILTIAFGPEGATLDADRLRRPLLRGALPVLDYFSVLILVTTAITFISLHLLMTRTPMGRRLRAIATNPELAVGIGIPASVATQQVAALAAALSLPAAVFLLFSTGLAPNESLHIVLVAAVTAILGGRGSLSGALVAGLTIGIAESLSSWQFATGWRQLVTFSVLYVVMLFRPQGLFGKAA